MTFTVPKADVNVSDMIIRILEPFMNKDSQVRQKKCRQLSLKWWRKPVQERDTGELVDWTRQLSGLERHITSRLCNWMTSEGIDGQTFVERLMEGMSVPGVPLGVLDKVREYLGLGQILMEAGGSLYKQLGCGSVAEVPGIDIERFRYVAPCFIFQKPDCSPEREESFARRLQIWFLEVTRLTGQMGGIL